MQKIHYIFIGIPPNNAMLSTGSIPWNIPRVIRIFFLYTQAFKWVFMQRICKWHVRYPMVLLSQARFIRCHGTYIAVHDQCVAWWEGSVDYPKIYKGLFRILIGCISYGMIWRVIVTLSSCSWWNPDIKKSKFEIICMEWSTLPW